MDEVQLVVRNKDGLELEDQQQTLIPELKNVEMESGLIRIAIIETMEIM